MGSPATARVVTIAIAAGIASSSAACIRRRGPAEPAEAAAAVAPSSQIARGRDLLAKRCASCHGRSGEGSGDVPPLLGHGALPAYREDTAVANSFGMHDVEQLEQEQRTRRTGSSGRGRFATMEDVFAFLRAHLPEVHLGSMPDEDRWAVLAFVAAAQGGALPPDGLSANTAPDVSIPRP